MLNGAYAKIASGGRSSPAQRWPIRQWGYASTRIFNLIYYAYPATAAATILCRESLPGLKVRVGSPLPQSRLANGIFPINEQGLAPDRSGRQALASQFHHRTTTGVVCHPHGTTSTINNTNKMTSSSPTMPLGP